MLELKLVSPKPLVKARTCIASFTNDVTFEALGRSVCLMKRHHGAAKKG